MLVKQKAAAFCVPAGTQNAVETSDAGVVPCFLSGLRRGLAYRQASRSIVAQIASMFWLFVPGARSLLSPRRVPALIVLPLWDRRLPRDGAVKK